MPNECKTSEGDLQAKLDSARAVVIKDITAALEDGIKVIEEAYKNFNKPQENKLDDFLKNLKKWACVLNESKEEDTDEEDTDDEEEKKGREGRKRNDRKNK